MLTWEQIRRIEARKRDLEAYDGCILCPSGVRRYGGPPLKIAPMYPSRDADGHAFANSEPPGTVVLDTTDPDNPRVSLRHDDDPKRDPF